MPKHPRPGPFIEAGKKVLEKIAQTKGPDASKLPEGPLEPRGGDSASNSNASTGTGPTSTSGSTLPSRSGATTMFRRGFATRSSNEAYRKTFDRINWQEPQVVGQQPMGVSELAKELKKQANEFIDAYLKSAHKDGAKEWLIKHLKNGVEEYIGLVCTFYPKDKDGKIPASGVNLLNAIIGLTCVMSALAILHNLGAELAKKFNFVEQDIATLEQNAAMALLLINRLEKEKAVYEDKIKRKKDKGVKSDEELVSLQSELMKINELIASKSEALHKDQTRCTELHARLQKLSEEISAAKANCEQLQSTAGLLSNVERYFDLPERCSFFSKELMKSQKTRAQLEKVEQSVQSDNYELVGTVTKLDEELTSLRERAANVENKITVTRADLKQRQASVAVLKDAYEQNLKDIDRCINDINRGKNPVQSALLDKVGFKASPNTSTSTAEPGTKTSGPGSSSK